ncbi:MAG: hypothetical protein JNL96_15060 [Planctomycetaceae bacterium]|nr:hypothetical protein [Planctomycetaceae bacterium]
MIANAAPNPKPFLQYLAEEDIRLEKLFEAIDLANSVIDPLEPYRDGGETWLPVGRGFTGATRANALGLLTAGFDTETELDMARDEMRYLAATNPYAINAHENRQSYILGDGHTYDVAVKKKKKPKARPPVVDGQDGLAGGGKQRRGSGNDREANGNSLPPASQPGKPGADGRQLPSNQQPPQLPADDIDPADEELACDAQESIDEFIEENDWVARQQEIVLRLDRDGEVFLRYFEGSDGVLRVRFVEPGHVRTPMEKADDPNVRFGIEFDSEDAETPIRYFIKGVPVDAAEIQHRKANVDRTTPRGVPLLFGQRMHLRRANKNVLNISAKIDIISAIGLIRKHSGSQTGVQRTVSAAAQFQATDSRSNQTIYARRFEPGTILDTSDTVSYEAPSVDGVDQLSAGVALNLRCIASRLVMPEFMVSSDASNANYASTMVAEGPSVKSFERLQKRQSSWDIDVLWKALEVAGHGERKELKKRIEIRVGMPTIISRDDYKKAQENEILYGEGVISPQEWASQAGVDYEKMQAEIAEHKAFGRHYGPDMPPPAPFGANPFGGDGGDGQGGPPSSRKPGDGTSTDAAIRGLQESFRNYP